MDLQTRFPWLWRSAILSVLVGAVTVAALTGTLGAPQSGSGFKPLDRWASAILSGDPAALKSLYSSATGTFATTPQGTTPNAAAEESAFWSALSARGLVSLTPKILEQTAPKPGQMDFVLRVEMSFRAPGSAPPGQPGVQKEQRALAVVRQTWVEEGNNWLIAATRRSDLDAMETITLPQPKTPNTHLYPAPNEAKPELAKALAAARADHKRVLVVFGANWCYDCHVLDATLRSSQVAPLVAANFHVIHVNIGDYDSNSDLADRFGVPLKKGIPSLAVLDGSGKLITSQKNGEFESAAKIGMSDVLGFLNEWKPPHA